ncbi:NAD(P)-dependent dehydrogenase, short-chain alcohol dehydrogenase family [Brevibacterium siliguriense]|uniref:NAD(P)-dependent dehydrogenase, short-chain alcohol dehydrogenase family n=1 Tax=Brevibacterium siliguriense TaxID=1136497 RepID=A0A1H1Y1M3_9MICO|nr:SDR family oxidoreductase [Brevibacterium siliguriense]SDT15295.1 NAD(P)-dependent dehydrogenase, short-chain alcohol dehydrogenase family [Brevibacterium siliguriense]
MTEQTLQGKNILIAGGGKNLGGLIARQAAAAGADIAIHYNSESTRPEAEETLAAVESSGSKSVLLTGDLTKPANVERLFDDAVSALGSIDIAVNTTGKVLRKPIAETTEDEYDSMFDINAKAAYFFIKEAGKHLADNGKIVTIVTALLAAFTDGYSTYAGGKSPVEHFTRAAAKEYADRGISVTAIAPGPMDTPFFYGQETPERVEFHKSQGMGNRLTQIEDIAPIVRFLATEGNWITGQTIFANGGYTTR